MRLQMLTYLSAVSSLLVSCAQQQVAHCVDDHAEHEGLRYADEVEAQSPFTTLKVSWSGAVELMEERNLAYRKARRSYESVTEEKPLLTQFSSQLKSSVGISMKDALKPKAIAKTMQDPIAGLPQQLGSVSALKDISHNMQQTAWSDEGDLVEARMQMRKERVKLYTLLSKGDVIDAELERIQKSQIKQGDKVDARLKGAQNKWRSQVEKERNAWLSQIRNFFNAEYFDVKFRKDDSAMPMYRGMKSPDLSEWQRWSYLSRSQSLVKELRAKHKKSKPVVPGTRVMKAKMNEFLNKDPEFEVELDTNQVRGDVRKLISNWRELKRTQAELRELESASKVVTDAKAELARAQKVYKLRQQEIKHASVVWLMDEECWMD